LKVLLLGASGLVGRYALVQTLSLPEISHVVAPSRKPLNPHNKLTNPVTDRLPSLVAELPAWDVDGLICCIGTTIKKAGSQEAFREVDYVLPLMFAKAARMCGATAMGLVTAIGASSDSRFYYAKTKGDLETDVMAIGFPSLTIVRPSIIGGKRDEFRFAESAVLRMSKILGPMLPKKLRISPAPNIATALIDGIVEQPPGCHFRYAESLV